MLVEMNMGPFEMKVKERRDEIDSRGAGDQHLVTRSAAGNRTRILTNL